MLQRFRNQAFTLIEPPVVRHRKRAAFTLIELLVVIAIIGIVIGIVFAGARSYMASQRANATRITLGNLKGMLGELENANSLKSQPAGWLWWDSGGPVTNAKAQGQGAGYTPDFWKMPFYLNNTPPTPPAVAFSPLVAPGDVGGEGADDVRSQRFGSIASVNTMLAMSMIAALPVNRTRLQSFPADQLTIPVFTDKNVKNAGGDLWLDDSAASASPDTTSDKVVYEPGVHVKMNVSGKDYFFVATGMYNPGAPSAPSVGGASTAAWFDESAAPNNTPLVLDAWDNPIIFVPATGMTVYLKNGESDYKGLATQRFIVISPEGTVANNLSGTLNPTVTRPGRPFWASAGPDGDFSKGDDNVYSFEQ